MRVKKCRIRIQRLVYGQTILAPRRWIQNEIEERRVMVKWSRRGCIGSVSNRDTGVYYEFAMKFQPPPRRLAPPLKAPPPEAGPPPLELAIPPEIISPPPPCTRKAPPAEAVPPSRTKNAPPPVGPPPYEARNAPPLPPVSPPFAIPPAPVIDPPPWGEMIIYPKKQHPRKKREKERFMCVLILLWIPTLYKFAEFCQSFKGALRLYPNFLSDFACCFLKC